MYHNMFIHFKLKLQPTLNKTRLNAFASRWFKCVWPIDVQIIKKLLDRQKRSNFKSKQTYTKQTI